MGMILETSAIQGTVHSRARRTSGSCRATASPGYGSKPVIPTNSGSALFVYSDDPAKQRAAWELITFLTGDEAYTMISSKIGYLPLRTGLVERPQRPEVLGRAEPADPAQHGPARAAMEPWVSFPGNELPPGRATG